MSDAMINIHAAKTRLSRLLARVEKGERIVIARNGKPVAQLIPTPKRRRLLSNDDPLLRVEEYSFKGRIGKMTNSEIDRVVYGI
jgi:prevent-host-death family protein